MLFNGELRGLGTKHSQSTKQPEITPFTEPLSLMAGPKPVGNTVGADYARRELKMRGELRKGMNLSLGA